MHVLERLRDVSLLKKCSNSGVTGWGAIVTLSNVYGLAKMQYMDARLRFIAGAMSPLG